MKFETKYFEIKKNIVIKKMIVVRNEILLFMLLKIKYIVNR
jgi:hypothetical protein